MSETGTAGSTFASCKPTVATRFVAVEDCLSDSGASVNRVSSAVRPPGNRDVHGRSPLANSERRRGERIEAKNCPGKYPSSRIDARAQRLHVPIGEGVARQLCLG